MAMLQTALWAVEGVLPWNRDGVEAAVRAVAQHWQWPIREVTVPLTVAVTGARVGPPLFESIALLGADRTRWRLQEAIRLLGGLPKKQVARLEQEWGARRAPRAQEAEN